MAPAGTMARSGRPRHGRVPRTIVVCGRRSAPLSGGLVLLATLAGMRPRALTVMPCRFAQAPDIDTALTAGCGHLSRACLAVNASRRRWVDPATKVTPGPRRHLGSPGKTMLRWRRSWQRPGHRGPAEPSQGALGHDPGSRAAANAGCWCHEGTTSPVAAGRAKANGPDDPHT